MNNIYTFAEQDEIISPQLVVYPALIRENIRRMIGLAGGPERLCPHLKTHKMAAVTKMLLSEGISKCKCATIAEAEMATDAGMKTIVLAYPLVGPNIARFLALSAAYPDVVFYAIGDDTGAVEALSEKAQGAGWVASLLMDVDMGQHRTGVALDAVVEKYLAWNGLPGIAMSGMHCYDGHRHESDLNERDAEVAKVDPVIDRLKRAIIEAGAECAFLVYGGTPSFPCHQAQTDGFLSPGTCVLHDAGYRDAFPDLSFVPAATVLTRVVSRPSACTFTLDIGVKAIAADPPIPRCEIVGFEDAETVMQNEEHLVLRVPPERADDIPPIGTVLYAIPTHVCPTSALYPQAAAVEDGHLIAWWDVTARNRRITF